MDESSKPIFLNASDDDGDDGSKKEESMEDKDDIAPSPTSSQNGG